jgi:hypothetical protein
MITIDNKHEKPEINELNENIFNCINAKYINGKYDIHATKSK